VTDKATAKFHKIATDAAESIGLPFAGIDILAPHPELSGDDEAYVLEVNATPLIFYSGCEPQAKKIAHLLIEQSFSA